MKIKLLFSDAALAVESSVGQYTDDAESEIENNLNVSNIENSHLEGNLSYCT